MQQELFLPEGYLLDTADNQKMTACSDGLELARDRRRILEAVVTLCDDRRDLYVRLGDMRGRIPREEAGMGQLREIAILSRVGKPVCFQVIGREGETWLLSRRAAQLRASDSFEDTMIPGTVIPAAVTHLERFGAFVDIGCGLVSMIGLERISVSRICHADQRFYPGQQILAAVSHREPGGRICLTHRELLGTWQENADALQVGSAVKGIVRGVEPYGVFVELSPNLSGLAEPCPEARVGMEVAVYVKSVLPDRMKVKLTVLDLLPGSGKRLICPEDYRIRRGRIQRWQYQPDACCRGGSETVFW